jgi:hypothetical protein
MAAECEIDDCGVLAIGRCAVGCERAMCASHRSKDRADECSECRSSRYKAQADSFHEANRRTDLARQKVQMIARRLLEAGFPPDTFLQEGSRFKDRWFGGQKQVRDRSADVYGWLVGEYTWRERDAGMYGGDREVKKRVKTFVTSYGSITREGTGWHSEDHLSAGGYVFWEEIAAKMSTIARQHGVEIT